MLRPTAHCEVQLSRDFYFDSVKSMDLECMAKAVYAAHLHGYTASKAGAPDLQEMKTAVDRRLRAFSQTGTLHYGTVVKERLTDDIAGICLAGIYPDALNDFSTIHQVSVLPAYRRQGLARAMICKAIQAAHERSPVVTLGVMVGNPAELLYRELGFVAGKAYWNWTYRK